MLSLNELYLPAILLYAETHFRFFRHFPSLLYKKTPEILFDVPHRIGPDADLPVLLLINDVNRFEAKPVEVAITVSRIHGKTAIYRFNSFAEFEVGHPFTFRQRAFIFPLKKEVLPEGQLFINATVTVQAGKRQSTVFNDNFNTSSRRGYCCFRSRDQLPGSDLCSYGDLHCHSQFSQSHVEFGAPLDVIDRMAKSSGLTFIGITDHSYDLSCKKDNYLEEDQQLVCWNLQKQLLSDPSAFSTILLQGEEISCNNETGATIHLGALGISEFIAGSLDGARKNRLFTSQLTIKQAHEAIQKQGGITFSAHPGSSCGLLQRLFLSRGSWSEHDLLTGIDAIQAFNDGFGNSWRRAKSMWINLLQHGHRIPIIAGNDAHGDFNRYHAIKTPFLSIYEDFQRFMGYGKTGIYGQCTTRDQVIVSLRHGAAFISTGPYLSINYTGDPTSHAISASVRPYPKANIFLHCISNQEYGAIQKVSLLSGVVGENKPETHIYLFSPVSNTYEWNVPVALPDTSCFRYFRAEVETRCTDGSTYAAFTNCCFFEPQL